MRVGIISDTHDRLNAIGRMVERLNHLGVELVLHAGDFVSPFVLPRLFALQAPIVGVFGNNDGDRALLSRRAAERERFDLQREFEVLNLDGATLLLTHNLDAALLERIVKSERFDVVARGHTHRAEVSWHEKTLVVNPGEVCGYVTGRSTFAVLDTEMLNAEIFELQ